MSQPLIPFDIQDAKKYLVQRGYSGTVTSDAVEEFDDTSQSLSTAQMLDYQANARIIAQTDSLAIQGALIRGAQRLRSTLAPVVKSRTVDAAVDNVLFLESPFDELYLIRSNELPFLAALDKLCENTELVFIDVLKEELNRLLEMYKDDYEGKALSADSLDGLISFLKFSEITIKPGVTALSNGDLYAQWKHEDFTLSIHFMKTFIARYALIKPDQKHHEQWAHNSGAASVDSLWDEISNLNFPNRLIKIE